jgi:hypothetical protein
LLKDIKSNKMEPSGKLGFLILYEMVVKKLKNK